MNIRYFQKYLEKKNHLPLFLSLRLQSFLAKIRIETHRFYFSFCTLVSSDNHICGTFQFLHPTVEITVFRRLTVFDLTFIHKNFRNPFFLNIFEKEVWHSDWYEGAESSQFHSSLVTYFYAKIYNLLSVYVRY